MAKNKKIEDLEKLISELTADLQRTRADFENYRKRVDSEKDQARQTGKTKAVLGILPIIDTVEKAIANVPPELSNDPWAMGVKNLHKQLTSQLKTLGVVKVSANPGDEFNPEFHQAIKIDELASGEVEVIDTELQPGYLLDGVVIRYSMVSVTKTT